MEPERTSEFLIFRLRAVTSTALTMRHKHTRTRIHLRLIFGMVKCRLFHPHQTRQLGRES